MNNQQILENKYLKAKIAYYEGNEDRIEDLMTDAEFDELEKILKNNGSKVIEQVGSKRKDFDFAHPTKMLSLAKIQTERIDKVINYQEDEYKKWLRKCQNVVGNGFRLSGSPKFDGSAINIIYQCTTLNNILTRGDGLEGKDVTTRLRSKVKEELVIQGLNIEEEDTIEIRCEAVIKLSLFKEKYFGKREDGKYANARNFVAGVIGKDDYDQEKIDDITLIPLHFLVNGKQVHPSHFNHNTFCTTNHDIIFEHEDYINIIKKFEKLRETYKFQLDGVVISMPVPVREILGENDHDPEWAIAIKFVPEGAITTVIGIEWNVSKRGELTPVILLDPVELAGTIVKRASGYNAGYLVDNGICIGASVSIAKAGDIIPEIQKVIYTPGEPVNLPTNCPDCGTKLTFNKIHLSCSNEHCVGRISKKLASASGILDLKGVGGERLKPFAKRFANMYELWAFVLENGGESLGEFGLEPGTRLNEIFVNAFKNIKSIPYEKVIQILGYDNVGRKITQQLAREHAGLDFSYASLEKALVAKLHLPDVVTYIDTAICRLESLGVIIDRPIDIKEDPNIIPVVMTGSPKEYGFKTKKDFLAKYPNLYDVNKLNDPSCKFLITDNPSSISKKMTEALKKGIEIKTYGDF